MDQVAPTDSIDRIEFISEEVGDEAKGEPVVRLLIPQLSLECLSLLRVVLGMTHLEVAVED